MKRKPILLIALVLTLTAVLSLFPGCGDKTEPPESEHSTEVPATDLPEQTEAPKVPITLAGGTAKYTVIRSYLSNDLEVDAAKNLNVALKDYSADWRSSISDDFVMGQQKGDIITNDNYEIAVGNTNRAESREVYESLPDNSYKICVRGNKLIIVGKTDYMTLMAVNDFIDEFVKPGILTFEPDFVLEKNLADVLAGKPVRLFSWNLGCACGNASDVLTVINRYEPTIIALQECNSSCHSNVVKVYMKKHPTFKYVQEKHSGSSTYVYTPIIYDSSRLTLIEGGAEWLDGRYTGTNTKCLEWAVFEDIFGKKVAMVNFHGAVCSADYSGYENMTSSERNTIAANWRIDNVRQILDVKKRINDKYENIPFTVNGDCNFNATSVPYANLQKAGFIDSESGAVTKINAGFKTSGRTIVKGNSIDHIFGTTKIKFDLYQTIQDEEAPKGSDHFPIFSDYFIVD